MSSPHFAAMKEKAKRNGTDVALRAVGSMFWKLDKAAKLIEASPATASLRAKTLAAIWRFIPSTSTHGGFEFDDSRCVEGLFRACVSVARLSDMTAEIETKLQR